MKTLFIGQYCIKPDQTDSTNSFLTRALSEKNLPEGTAVITEKQEQGRGQRGTFWESERGKNLTFSFLLFPSFLKPDEQFILSKSIALALNDFVGSCFTGAGSLTKIKWPNDIYIGDKKVAGILIENSVSGNQLSHSIAGIGININQERFSSALPNPVSLKLITGKEFDLKECFEDMCSCIESRYLQLKRKENSKIDSDYIKSMYRFGEWSSYKFKAGIINAKICGVSEIGKLILEKENGEKLECDVKDVRFL